MEETRDQEEGNDDLEEKECPHNERREDSDKTVHKTGVKAVHAGDVPRPKERQNDEKQLVLVSQGKMHRSALQKLLILSDIS